MDALEKKAHINKINKTLLSLDKFPLLRTYVSFDYKKFEELLKERFEIKDLLKIEITSTKWLTKETLLENLSDNVNYLAFTFSPLESNAYLLIAEEDIKKLTNLLTSKKNTLKLSSSILQESYFRYISLQVLDALVEMNFFQDLSPKIVEETSKIEEDSLCLDIKIKINETTIICKIAIPNKFRKSWEEYFSSNPPLKAFELSKSIELVMSAEIGSVSLNYQTLKKIEAGDFIILDTINYDPKTNKGTAILKLDNTKFFLAKIKQNKLKILDYASYEEVGSKMTNKEEKNEEIALPKEENVEVESANEMPTQALQDMPVQIVIEAARFKITLDKLMNMQPGNLIDLKVHPEAGVDLVVNGEKIARGEIVQIGDSLGVRILQIG
ncbi:MAG: type III secretion system cytoplasmic ring protein SctQ [Parachlamydiales bacterium]|nr:type III secretion system cytoplasmic ring protein SctQ [Parachlamydiales bacterium]